MLIKSSSPGAGIAGQMNYLYEGKLELRQEANKQAEVILHSDNIRVPYSSEDEKGRKRLISDFIEQSKNHKNYSKKTKYVGEHIISFTSSDVKKLGKNNLRDIVKDYAELSGIDKTQFVAITHKDTSNFHVHLIFNRAMNDGTKFNDSYEKLATTNRAIVIALNHNFALTGEQHRLALTKDVLAIRSTQEPIQQIRNSDELLKNARNLHHLIKLAEEKGITIKQNEKDKSIEIEDKKYNFHDLNAIFYYNREQVKNKEKLTLTPDTPSTKDVGQFVPNVDQKIKGTDDFNEVSLSNSRLSNSQDKEQPNIVKKKRIKGYKIKIANQQNLVKSKQQIKQHKLKL